MSSENMSSENIRSRAAAALERARRAGLPVEDPDRTPAPVRRAQARISRHLSALLGIDQAFVHVGYDFTRATRTAPPGYLVTVHDPARPDFVFRFIPEPGDEDLFLLLGPCPLCDSEVPIASVGSLIEFGLALERAADPDRWAESMPAEFDLDPGHAQSCPAGVAHTEAYTEEVAG